MIVAHGFPAVTSTENENCTKTISLAEPGPAAESAQKRRSAVVWQSLDQQPRVFSSSLSERLKSQEKLIALRCQRLARQMVRLNLTADRDKNHYASKWRCFPLCCRAKASAEQRFCVFVMNRHVTSRHVTLFVYMPPGRACVPQRTRTGLTHRKISPFARHLSSLPHQKPLPPPSPSRLFSCDRSR